MQIVAGLLTLYWYFNAGLVQSDLYFTFPRHMEYFADWPSVSAIPAILR